MCEGWFFFVFLRHVSAHRLQHFFASCEVASQPELEGKTVVAANDNENGGGTILTLTTEAKALGLKRGNPLFQVRNLIRLNHMMACPVDHKKYRRISHILSVCLKLM